MTGNYISSALNANMAADMEKWLSRELGKLGIQATEENARCILSMQDSDDLEEYMLELLDGSDPKVRLFLQELRSRSSSVKVYQKKNDSESVLSVKQKKKNRGEGNKKSTPTESVVNGSMSSDKKSESMNVGKLTNKSVIIDNNEEIGIGAKRKSKFVPLYSREGQEKSIVHLPGRHICECLASKHKLINNCLHCGRIVCEQEGAGPCVFCGKLVCTPEDEEVLARGSKKSDKLRNQLMREGGGKGGLSETGQSLLSGGNRAVSGGFDDALSHRDRLLEYDRTSARRTQVIDDQCDYFATDSNRWLTKEDREKLRKREEELRNVRHGSRRDRKVTLDFAGRRVIDESEGLSHNMYNKDDAVVQEVLHGKSSLAQSDMINLPTQLQTLKYVESNPVSWGPKTKNEMNLHTSASRIQDRELQEMSDEGMCLSMHQPWASLLVCGIKMHEGRTWYSSHRGRLWIAATAKTPPPEDIEELEDLYKKLYQGKNFQFPSSYPTACLLGCVNVDECLDQDAYRDKYPDGESASAYVFICTTPQQLLVKFPIKGKHKIYKLETHIHQAAKKGLR